MNLCWKFTGILLVLLASSEVNAIGSCTSPFGNVNGDQLVNVVDVQCLILATVAQLDGDPFNDTPLCLDESAASADLNCDGSMNLTDVLVGAQLAVGVSLSPFLEMAAFSWPNDHQAGFDLSSPSR